MPDGSKYIGEKADNNVQWQSALLKRHITKYMQLQVGITGGTLACCVVAAPLEGQLGFWSLAPVQEPHLI